MQVYSSDNALSDVRTFRHKGMDAAYMEEFMINLDRLATSCAITEPAHPHQRGNFAQLRFGWNHGMGEADNVSFD